MPDKAVTSATRALVRRRRHAIFAERLNRAVGRPRSLAFAGTFAMTALALLALGQLGGAAIALLAGSVGYGSFVLLEMADESRGQPEPAPPRRALAAFDVAPEEIEVPELRQRYGDILRLYARIGIILQQAGPVADALKETFRSADHVVREAGRAAVSSGPVARYLRERSAVVTRAHAADLERRAASTRDQVACELYLQAAAAADEQARVIDQLEGLGDRIHADLEAIEAALAALEARVIQLLADVDEPESGDGRGEIDRLALELAIVRAALEPASWGDVLFEGDDE